MTETLDRSVFFGLFSLTTFSLLPESPLHSTLRCVFMCEQGKKGIKV